MPIPPKVSAILRHPNLPEFLARCTHPVPLASLEEVVGSPERLLTEVLGWPNRSEEALGYLATGLFTQAEVDELVACLHVLSLSNSLTPRIQEALEAYTHRPSVRRRPRHYSL